MSGSANERFSIDSTETDGGIAVRLSGNADMIVTGHLSSYLERLHTDAMAKGMRQVTFDVRELYFLTSSCLKCIATFLSGAASVEPERRYRVRFLANHMLHWQRRSLEALRCVATDIIEIETDPSSAT
ncbi:MAG TPA: hypothetical protein VJT73_16465 [Polyangiaceae bacterium]|nr:hypothetical protein [Polyangiaceae bacterium]